MEAALARVRACRRTGSGLCAGARRHRQQRWCCWSVTGMRDDWRRSRQRASKQRSSARCRARAGAGRGLSPRRRTCCCAIKARAPPSEQIALLERAVARQPGRFADAGVARGRAYGDRRSARATRCASSRTCLRGGSIDAGRCSSNYAFGEPETRTSVRQAERLVTELAGIGARVRHAVAHAERCWRSLDWAHR